MLRKSLGGILVSRGVVTQEQLDKCLKKAQDENKSVHDCLLELGFVSNSDVARALAELAGLSFLDKITDKFIDPKLLEKVPLKFLRDNAVMPIAKDGGVVILTSNPRDFQPIDDLNLIFGGQALTAVATREAIIDSINHHYPLEGAREAIEELEEDKDISDRVDFSDVDEHDIMGAASDAPVVKLVNNILFKAVKRDATDIHIEPMEKEVEIRYRIDGVLYPALTPPKRVQSALVSRIKIMSHLNIAEKRMPQDGRIEIKIADKSVDLRVNVLPTTFGERVSIRLLDKGRTFGDLKSLGFSARDLEVVDESIRRPNGIIFVSGPTGSGKTSTLYSILSKLNTSEVNIITVEDPVEYQLNGIGQVPVKAKIGMTFAIALRAILRQDPDIIMIGETRDQETAKIAIQSALTGHLVLSTIHTNSAPATVTRLLDMGTEPFLIASSVCCVIGQRLVRRLCEKCKEAYRPAPQLLKSLGLSEEAARHITFYKAKKCEQCSFTGYKGRLALFEVMKMSNEIARLTMERADTALLRDQAMKDGMTRLIDDGIEKIREGLTTIDEVLGAATVQ